MRMKNKFEDVVKELKKYNGQTLDYNELNLIIARASGVVSLGAILGYQRLLIARGVIKWSRMGYAIQTDGQDTHTTTP